jgi:hypothetical protein
VRADSAGKLAVGPIGISALLDGAAQTVEVEFQAKGKTTAGHERPVTRFGFNTADQDKERYWSIFTGQLDYLPEYRYRVHVVVKGSLFTSGMEWWSEWRDTSGNGPLIAVVPTQEEAAQIRRMVPNNRPRAVELPPGTGPLPTTRPAASAVGAPHSVSNGASASTVAGRPPGRSELASRDVQGYSVGTPVKAAKPMTAKAAPAKPAGKPVGRSDTPVKDEELVLVSGWSTQPNGDN